MSSIVNTAWDTYQTTWKTIMKIFEDVKNDLGKIRPRVRFGSKKDQLHQPAYPASQPKSLRSPAMPVTVTHELTVDERCAYVLAYGEYDDGTDYAEVVTAKALQRWGDDLRYMVLGNEVPGYSPIFTCGYCGEDSEGASYEAEVIKDVK